MRLPVRTSGRCARRPVRGCSGFCLRRAAGAARLASLPHVLKHGRGPVWLAALGLAAPGCAGVDAGVLDELLRQAGAGRRPACDAPSPRRRSSEVVAERST